MTGDRYAAIVDGKMECKNRKVMCLESPRHDPIADNTGETVIGIRFGA